ncbi:uncharacterized protein EHS24_000551 [Apiotrichum porosum]|uniref:Uncharacterized protein n=1 Tax=Apiotrichum porosum TaxID=105984 RepID=A0A427YAP6_9TREE|nr:uncharacterized protein EHS24_000551 [Apiotrichum porosum]RSH88027.1 hypothetical protein EHS24_000551 [Apiotrichum porosum]
MTTPTIDTAICPHLRTTRTVPSRQPAAHDPQTSSAHCARWAPGQQVVLMTLGAQHGRPGHLPSSVLDTPLALVAHGGPGTYDVGTSTDAAGREARTVLAYWPSRAAFATWRSASGFDTWWNDAAREVEPGGYGWFLEVVAPTDDRMEALLGSAAGLREGAARLAPHASGPVREAGYWGASRDRLGIAQTDAVAGLEWCGDTERAKDDRDDNASGVRVKVRTRRNLCFTRSGQDWTGADDDERALYLSTLHLALQRAMDKLRDSPKMGCYSARFVRQLAPPSPGSNEWTEQDKTYGLAYFDDLASLEAWAAAEPTHLELFHGLSDYATQLKGNKKLQLWHEIFILTPDQQEYEYINCPPGTGMLASL